VHSAFEIRPAKRGSGRTDVSQNHDLYFTGLKKRTTAVLADAGPLYAVVDPDDSQHRRGRAGDGEAGRRAGGRIVGCGYSTLLETYSLILFSPGEEYGRQTGAHRHCGRFFDPIQAAEDYRPGRRQAPRISRPAHHPGLTQSAATLATRLRLQVWTYDHHLM